MPIYVLVSNGSVSDGGWGAPANPIETQINLNGVVTVTVNVVGSTALDKVQTFTFTDPSPFVTINMEIHEDEVAGEPGDGN